MINRRDFIKNSSLIAASLGVSSLFPGRVMATVHSPAPSDRINIGVIGLGMGCTDLRGILENPWVHCIAMCDVNKDRLDKEIASFKEKFPSNAGHVTAYTDFRELLDNKDIDGVIIATPDHWHAAIFARALQAGKAVYIEKPVANSIAECNSMIDLQEKYKGVVTTGLWQTSQRYFTAANDILKTGVLGDVYKVHIFLCQSTNPRAGAPDQAVPASLDYNMWLGPAPERHYNPVRVRSWRGFWDYGGGQQTDWGVHWLDSAFDGLEALGKSGRVFPKSVFSVAQKDPTSFNETPSCQTSIFQYDDFHIEWTQQVANLYNRRQGVAWIGNKATLVCNREGYELIPQANKDGSFNTYPMQLVGKFEDGGVVDHTRNWAECIRDSNINTNSPIQKGAFATILAHMANISYRTGTRVVYNPQTRTFENNPQANTFLKPEYRSPWVFPTI